MKIRAGEGSATPICPTEYENIKYYLEKILKLFGNSFIQFFYQFLPKMVSVPQPIVKSLQSFLLNFPLHDNARLRFGFAKVRQMVEIR